MVQIPFVFNERHLNAGQGLGSADDAMHRRYNRWWGRFEQPDPYDGSYSLTNPQSFNRYAYTQNDPVNFVDPTGLNLAAPGGSGGETHCVFVHGFVNDARTLLSAMCMTIGGGFVGDPGGAGNGGDSVPQNTQAKDPLPFNSCEQFVDYLVGLASSGVKKMNDLSVGSVNQVISDLGLRMMMTARFEYGRHINNRADGFRPELTKGNQGAGVYGHVLGIAGARLFGLSGDIVLFGQMAKDVYDYYRAAPKDRDTNRAELAGNGAGVRAGRHMWNFMTGSTPRDPQRLKNSLMKEMCK